MREDLLRSVLVLHTSQQIEVFAEILQNFGTEISINAAECLKSRAQARQRTCLPVVTGDWRSFVKWNNISLHFGKELASLVTSVMYHRGS